MNEKTSTRFMNVSEGVLYFWNVGQQSKALEYLITHVNEDKLATVMEEQDLAYTDDVIMGLVDDLRQRADDLDDCSPDTRGMARDIREINNISITSKIQDVPIWDVSWGTDNVYTVDSNKINQLVAAVTRK